MSLRLELVWIRGLQKDDRVVDVVLVVVVTALDLVLVLVWLILMARIGLILIVLLHKLVSYLLCLLNLLLYDNILKIFHFKLIDSLLFVQLVGLELLHASEHSIILNILLGLRLE